MRALQPLPEAPESEQGLIVGRHVGRLPTHSFNTLKYRHLAPKKVASPAGPDPNFRNFSEFPVTSL